MEDSSLLVIMSKKGEERVHMGLFYNHMILRKNKGPMDIFVINVGDRVLVKMDFPFPFLNKKLVFDINA